MLNWYKFITVLFVIIPLMFQCQSDLLADQNQYCQKVLKQGDDVIISFRYKKNTDMHVVIGRCGTNQMVNFKKIYLEKNNCGQVNSYIGKKARILMESCTDWIGPYAVKSLVNNDGGTYAFTGGWHSIKREGNAFKTGMTEKIVVKSGNSIVKDNTVYNGAASIEICNLIQGFNTNKAGRNVIREEITIEADRGVFTVNVKTTAIEDVLVMKYYGLQTQNSAWSGGIQYMNGPIFRAGKYSESEFKIKEIANSFLLCSKNKEMRLKCTLSRQKGLGTFENISDNMPTIFTESYGKTYFNLINGKGKVLKEGQSVNWEGKYEFM